MNRFQAVCVSDLAILSVLVESGWVHHWNGLHGRLRYCHGADVTAAIGLSGWGQQNIGFGSFFQGVVSDRAHLNRNDALKLGEVDPVVFNEALAYASRPFRPAARSQQAPEIDLSFRGAALHAKR